MFELTTMDLTRLFFSVCGFLWSTLWFAGVSFSSVCQSPQYIEIKSTGKVDCLFPESLYNLFWYDSTDVFHEEAVVTLLDSVKGGQGFLSGEFDIDSNGALIITNVTLEHEGTYTAIVLETPSSALIRYTVNVSVVAPAFIPLPRISGCNNASEICFQILDQHSEISCIIQDARPAVPLMWIVRSNSEDLNISSYLSISNKSLSFFTSLVTTTNPFVYTSRLTLLVCKATSPPGLLETYESFVLIQNSEIAFPVSAVKKNVEINDKLELNCTVNQMGYLVWQRKHYAERAFFNVVVAVLSGGNFQTQIGEDDYTVKASGMLVVNDVNTQHEGVYRCINGNGLEDGVVIYEVVVFALPVPTYLVVDGCDHQQYCVLEAQPEGRLQCSVRGIRPEVNIEFRPLHEKTSPSVHFYDNELTIKNNGDVLDISLISKYRLNDATQARMTIQCRVIETDIQQLLLSTNFDLVVKDRMTSTEKTSHNTKDGSEEKRHYWIIAPVLAVLLLLFIPIYICTARKKLLAAGCSIEAETCIPMMKLNDYEVQKKLFKSELSAKYQNLYGTVQPIPFIKELLYSVDNLFVDGGIEFLVTNDEISLTESWEKLDSYRDILCDPRVKSPRRILEGAPGYGKSTLCLQMAFEWCNQISSSPLKDIEIFILLSLNQLGGVKSIFAAIKQFLLPKDTLLTEELIQTTLLNSSSVLIVLDGFDEYPDQESNEKSDIMSLIAREMFQQFDVILTTRSSHLPREYPALTKRLKLTGFDNISRDKYIQKAIAGYDIEAAKKVHELLSNIPILRDICQVPFIFVMFAHLSHESKTFQTFQPVTFSFRYIISCFMSHMKRKMTNENFQNYDLFEENHRTLHKLAFEGLISKVRPIIWSKKYMSDKLGKQSYEKYVRIGILVEEGPINISDESDSKSLECIEYKAKVRFFHQSFCEWYAAHYLSDHRTLDDVTFHFGHKLMRLNESEASNVVFMDNATKVNVKEDYFHSLDPWDFHYFYRFASGLNFAVANYTIEYLKDQNGTNSFIILCNLEQYGKTKEGMQQVKEFCSAGPCIDKSYSLLLQRSTIQLLEIASLNKITILSLNLRECYHSVDVEGNNYIQLLSGLSVPLLTTLKELTITETCREFTPDEIANILQYSLRCRSLEKLRFWKCLLPQSCHAEASTDLSRKFEVVWYPYLTSLTSPVYKLDLQTGLWKFDGKIMTDEEYERAEREVRNISNIE